MSFKPWLTRLRFKHSQKLSIHGDFFFRSQASEEFKIIWDPSSTKVIMSGNWENETEAGHTWLGVFPYFLAISMTVGSVFGGSFSQFGVPPMGLHKTRNLTTWVMTEKYLITAGFSKASYVQLLWSISYGQNLQRIPLASTNPVLPPDFLKKLKYESLY